MLGDELDGRSQRTHTRIDVRTLAVAYSGFKFNGGKECANVGRDNTSNTYTDTLKTPVPRMLRLIRIVKLATASIVQADTTAAECLVTS